MKIGQVKSEIVQIFSISITRVNVGGGTKKKRHFYLYTKHAKAIQFMRPYSHTVHTVHTVHTA